ncbi:MAG: AzlD domain-containing protein [Pseudobdellovibrio sp.]
MITETYFWTITIFLAIGTLAILGSVIAISGRITISDRWKQLFSFIPAAILPALIAPAVFFNKGQVIWIAGKERLFVLILATVVCYFSRSTLATITFGLAALYFISQF